MTNATVASAVKSVNGPTLTLTYKGGREEDQHSGRHAGRNLRLGDQG